MTTGHEVANLGRIGKPFFAAAEEGRLVARRCDSCLQLRWYPTLICAECGSAEFSWTELSGVGEVYSWSTVYRPVVKELVGTAPYIVASIELVEGIRMMSNVVGIDEAEIYVGMPVKALFGASWDGRVVPVFRPAAGGEASD